MKAFLLAAGKGTRLRPYTDRIPKRLIPIHGKPLLKIWLELLAFYRVSAVFINTHHHAAQVDRFVEGIEQDFPLAITTGYEKELLGSAGTIVQNRWFVHGCDDFIIAYADNLTRVNLAKMIRAHQGYKQNGAVLTVGLFPTSAPRACGIAVLNRENRIINFIEKPTNPASRLANAGIYIASRDFFNYTFRHASPPDNGVLDLGYHILPALVGRMYGYVIPEYLRDIGTLSSYRRALEEWPQEMEK